MNKEKIKINVGIVELEEMRKNSNPKQFIVWEVYGKEVDRKEIKSLEIINGKFKGEIKL